MPTAARDDILDEAAPPSPAFKNQMRKYVYTRSSTSEAKDEQNDNNPAAASPKRKLDQIVDQADSAAESSSAVTTTATTTTTTTVRSTRSKIAQGTRFPGAPTTPSPGRRTRSRNNRNKGSTTSSTPGSPQTPATPANDDGSRAPTLSKVARTGVSRLRDTIPPNLILLFIGVNPGIMTGLTGHVYAHPSNLYWRFLHWSGITAHRHPPSDTYRLPELYCVGNTNIVTRATKDASQLSRAEMDAGVAVLEEKIAKGRPEAVCLVGKSIWETVWRVRKGRNIKKEEFRYGWQDERENMGKVAAAAADGGDDGWEGARVFVATTTSGLAAGMSIPEKQAVWNELGEWVKKRRLERGIPEPSQSVAMSASNEDS